VRRRRLSIALIVVSSRAQRGIAFLAAFALAACGHATPVSTAAAPAVAPAQAPAAPANAMPERLNDKEYWALEQEISEPGGYFQIRDNFTSNEMEIGQLFTMLRETHVSGDVYMGVGPEQNFTYIAAVRPRMAFVVDIRRQAVVQHLMFKAMFEMAKDRADFISLLFAKPRPAGLDTSATIPKLWEAYRAVASDSNLKKRNWTLVVDRLTKTHGFTFTTDEMDMLKLVFDAFYQFGPNIATRGYAAGRGGDFAELTGFSNDLTGKPKSFLSSEENYQYVKMLHEKNLIMPVSGDFGGPKTIRAIGSYLNEHHGKLRAFYVSNVEQYLFQDNKEGAFYANVATLPMDSTTVFIRPYSLRRFGGGGPPVPLCPIGSFLAAAKAQRVDNYNATLSCGQ
jgi:hypothetical protein